MVLLTMPQSKHEIQALLEAAGTQPRHRFGQNFMIDQNLVRVVAEAGLLRGDELVLEVGPGTGTLTEELLARLEPSGGEVLAIEIDRDLAAMLRSRFGRNPRFTLIEADALSSKHALDADLSAAVAKARAEERTVKLVSNLPYHIASPLVIELLIRGVDLLAFTVQREVADRLRAAPGTSAYGALTVMAQLLSRVEVLRTLPAQAFWPAPKIESALVRLTRQDRLAGRAPAFGAFLAALFSSRRKTLRRALEQGGVEASATLAASGLEGQLRAEQLAPAQLLELFLNAAPRQGA
jgi:16S rRNA (adenine1518-N6/adenine1519-N6)-dimethyltransferase